MKTSTWCPQKCIMCLVISMKNTNSSMASTDGPTCFKTFNSSSPTVGPKPKYFTLCLQEILSLYLQHNQSHVAIAFVTYLHSSQNTMAILEQSHASSSWPAICL
ncbi:uncharacterized [Tachysurus ichikawai]